jgi:hypothetical protein
LAFFLGRLAGPGPVLPVGLVEDGGFVGGGLAPAGEAFRGGVLGLVDGGLFGLFFSGARCAALINDGPGFVLLGDGDLPEGF